MSSTQYFTLAYLLWLTGLCALGARCRVAPGWLWAVLALGTATVVYAIRGAAT